METPPPKNVRLLVEDMKEEYIKGMPGGLDENYFRKLNILFKRIEELEGALEPFAQIGLRIRSKNETKDLVTARREDCVRAIDTMHPDNSEINEKVYLYPAR